MATTVTPVAERTLELNFGPKVSAFIWEAVHGPSTQSRETAAFGTRGDGKTWGAAGVMFLHAQEHFQRGYPLPTRWNGVADTFRSHELKTVRSLTDPKWAGCWSMRDDNHLAVFSLDGQELVHLDLFGIEDHGAADRVRNETHGQWFEEPAPAMVMVQSSGMSEQAWALGMTSQRLPTYKHPAIATLNYPDEDHWTWERWVIRQHPGSSYFRIPPGERATPEQREEWKRALEGQPDALARLLGGEPGVIMLGDRVAVGYHAVNHVARERLTVEQHAELWFGHDSAPNAHTHATIIGQRLKGQLRIYAGLVSQETGLDWHIKAQVLPWLGTHAPWALGEQYRERLHSRYDPAMDTGEGGDIDENPVRRLRRALGGSYQAGAVSWHGRSGPMLSAFNLTDGRGGWALQIDSGPDTETLRKALNGRWYYARNAAGTVIRDLPFKPNHPWEDLGDAFCYLIGGLAPSREPVDPEKRQRYATTAFNVYDYGRETTQRRATGSLS
jgi:hypothetical protein